MIENLLDIILLENNQADLEMTFGALQKINLANRVKVLKDGFVGERNVSIPVSFCSRIFCITWRIFLFLTHPKNKRGLSDTLNPLYLLERATGLEPATDGLEGRRSTN